MPYFPLTKCGPSAPSAFIFFCFRELYLVIIALILWTTMLCSCPETLALVPELISVAGRDLGEPVEWDVFLCMNLLSYSTFYFTKGDTAWAAPTFRPFSQRSVEPWGCTTMAERIPIAVFSYVLLTYPSIFFPVEVQNESGVCGFASLQSVAISRTCWPWSQLSILLVSEVCGVPDWHARPA